MKKRRVVITGIGVIAANGIGKDAFWSAIKEGRSGISLIERFDRTPFPTKIAGEVKNFNPADYIDKKQLRRMDRTSHFAIAAAKMAVEDAKIDLGNGYAERTGVIIGTSMCGIGYLLEQHDTFRDSGPMRISPFTALASFPDACTSQVSIALGIKGPSFSLSTACSSASDAVGYACEAIQSGKLDFIMMGGAEATLYAPIFASFCVARAMSTRNSEPEKASRPFNLDRDGFVLGEGAGIFVLEEYEHAKKRGAHIYAEVLGHGMTCDAYHMTAPDPKGDEAARAMEMALKNAKVSKKDIDYINAHGTSTQLNDKTETMVIKRVFGKQAYNIPVSSTKSMIGHLIGAAGSVELVATLLAMDAQMLPPTINYEVPDPECDLDYVPNKVRPAKIEIAMKNSFGFGGKNSILILGKV
ncbi:MAG: beta-ketoacyl-ACP synthase II [Candidatus Omnitrophica bacterium]|nr:beta-ketoacyl-ACP synthase II [Candidatus Omnitrophota bacterium]